MNAIKHRQMLPERGPLLLPLFFAMIFNDNQTLVLKFDELVFSWQIFVCLRTWRFTCIWENLFSLRFCGILSTLIATPLALLISCDREKYLLPWISSTEQRLESTELKENHEIQKKIETSRSLDKVAISHQPAGTHSNLVFSPKEYFSHSNYLLPLKKNSRKLFQIGKQYAIATDSKYSSHAAQEAFRDGGNVVDALVRASFVLAVVRPQSTGIGGGGFALLRFNGTYYAFDFRERAPLNASPQLFDRKWNNRLSSQTGLSSIAVPGLVAGLVSLQNRFGKLSLAQNLAPAIRLAKEGFLVYPNLARAIQSRKKQMNQAMLTIFQPNKIFLQTGDLLVQRDLAWSLEQIRDKGMNALYNTSGPVYQRLTQALLQEERTRIKKGFSDKLLLLPKDWQSYRMIPRTVLRKKMGENEIVTFPLPSAATYLVQMFEEIWNDFLFRKKCTSSWSSWYCTMTVAQAMRRGFEKRALFGGDPNFLTTFLEKSQSYMAANTTHLSIAGGQSDDVVLSTQSINYIFGSGILAKGTGIILNNTMDDFSLPNLEANVYGLTGGYANAISGGKTPLSNMSPTLILKKNKVYMGVGAMGGSFILSALLHLWINDLIFSMHPYASIAAPRFHYQGMPPFFVSEVAQKRPTKENLQKIGAHFTRISKHYAKAFMVKKYKNFWISVVDPRSNGMALAE